MYILKHFNQIHHMQDKPVKGSDWIAGAEIIDGKAEPLEYQGISDFSGFSLTDEKGNAAEFSDNPSADEELITQLAIVELYEKQLAQDEEILTTQLAIAELYELQEG